MRKLSNGEVYDRLQFIKEYCNFAQQSLGEDDAQVQRQLSYIEKTLEEINKCRTTK